MITSTEQPGKVDIGAALSAFAHSHISAENLAQLLGVSVADVMDLRTLEDVRMAQRVTVGRWPMPSRFIASEGST